MKPIHRRALELDLQGPSNIEIGRIVVMHPTRVANVRNSPIFVRERESLLAEVRGGIAREHSQRVGKAFELYDEILWAGVKMKDGEGQKVKIPVPIEVQEKVATRILDTLRGIVKSPSGERPGLTYEEKIRRLRKGRSLDE